MQDAIAALLGRRELAQSPLIKSSASATCGARNE
jgi:hypothetical protein